MTMAYTKLKLSALIFCFAKAAPFAAKCMLLIVVAVANEEGKMRCNSRAAWIMKNFLTMQDKPTIKPNKRINLRGVAKNKPKYPPTAVSVVIRQKSFAGVSRRLS